MKNKLLAILTSVMLSCLCLFTLTACDKPHEHTFTNYISDNNASCIANGTETAKCDNCDETNTREVEDSKLPHSFTNYISDNNASIDNDGTKTAKCDNCDAIDTIIDEGSRLAGAISFKTLDVNGTSVYGKVPNITENFSFINEIETLGDAKYIVSLDISGIQIVTTKTISLTVGDNNIYVTEIINDEPTNVYTVTIRRKPTYEVVYNLNNGTRVESQRFEEGDFVLPPIEDPIRAGYTFDGWDYDFSTPITSNITISAKWLAIFNCSNGEITGLTSHGRTLTKIVIPESIDNVEITSVGSYAFKDCLLLTSITIPNSVTNIGGYAFIGCYKLVEVINNSQHITVEKGSEDNGYLGYYALLISNCDSSYVSKLSIDSNDYVIYIDGIDKILVNYVGSQTELNLPREITKINKLALSYNDKITSVSIPDSVTSVGNNAFAYCTSLTSVSIPNSVTSIGSNTFTYCTSLTSVSIPDSVTSIGSNTFRYCTSLTSVSIPNSVTSVGNNAFAYCASLTNIVIPNGVESIGNAAFNRCISLTSVIVPNSVTSIGDYAFEFCVSLTDITIGNKVTSIGEYAFINCYKLVEVINKSPYITVEKGSEDNGYLGCYALSVSNCNSSYVSKISTDNNGYVIYTEGEDKILLGYVGTQTELNLPRVITKIYQYSFYSNDKITSVVMSESVKSIGEYAFAWCDSLTDAIIGNGVESIGEYAFYNCSSLISIIIPDSVTSIGNSAFENCESLTSIVIPDSVTSIGNSAFYNCTSLTSVVIPDSVESIGSHAFRDCTSLTSVVIPDSVESIGSYAFGYCTSLTSIVIPDSVTSIGSWAFCYCTSLTSIVILDRVTSIGNWVFGYCTSLTSIEIPDSVTSIGHGAFYNCSSLTTIKYRGTEEEWSAISKGSHWNDNTGDYTIEYNYAGE
ncbi:MAG: leucine-rich repeat protein [Clostridia bacterium]|nr:leucine-rich repeat protein [Clostridia bacterium]